VGRHLETSLLLAPGGEFAFIGIGMASSLDLIDAGVGARVLAVVSLTMACCAALNLRPRLAARLETGNPSSRCNGATAGRSRARVLVVGHGRVGQLVCDMLDHHKVPYLATDRDAARGLAFRSAAARSTTAMSATGCLERCASARRWGHRHHQQLRDRREIVRTARARRPDVLIVARTRRPTRPSSLCVGRHRHGAETIEASLSLPNRRSSGSACRWAGDRSIHETREVVRMNAGCGRGPGALAATVRQAGATPARRGNRLRLFLHEVVSPASPETCRDSRR